MITSYVNERSQSMVWVELNSFRYIVPSADNAWSHIRMWAGDSYIDRLNGKPCYNPYITQNLATKFSVFNLASNIHSVIWSMILFSSK